MSILMCSLTNQNKKHEAFVYYIYIYLGGWSWPLVPPHAKLEGRRVQVINSSYSYPKV